MPYKYVVSVDSRSFKDAPPIIMNVVNRLIWAGKKIVTDGTWKQFNELLCLGYMEQQAINVSFDARPATPNFFARRHSALLIHVSSTTTTEKKISAQPS